MKKIYEFPDVYSSMFYGFLKFFYGVLRCPGFLGFDFSEKTGYLGLDFARIPGYLGLDFPGSLVI